jgi:DNA-binding Lrp family transcriptional regulator
MSIEYKTVLTADDLNETDWRAIEVLREGRVSPTYLGDELSISREYASDRLTRLREHGIVTRLAPGLYELNSERVPKKEDDDADGP